MDQIATSRETARPVDVSKLARQRASLPSGSRRFLATYGLSGIWLTAAAGMFPDPDPGPDGADDGDRQVQVWARIDEVWRPITNRIPLSAAQVVAEHVEFECRIEDVDGGEGGE
jgi:hypothetical protein